MIAAAIPSASTAATYRPVSIGCLLVEVGHHATNPETSYRDHQGVGECDGFWARVHSLQASKNDKGDNADEGEVDDDCLLLAHLTPFLDKRLPNRTAGERNRCGARPISPPKTVAARTARSSFRCRAGQ